MTPKIRALIALAVDHPDSEEARTAAVKACQMMASVRDSDAWEKLRELQVLMDRTRVIADRWREKFEQANIDMLSFRQENERLKRAINDLSKVTQESDGLELETRPMGVSGSTFANYGDDLLEALRKAGL